MVIFVIRVLVCCLLLDCFDCCVFITVSTFVFFFFKQKTAYEMRISDWSSDVCSSDLLEATRQRETKRGMQIAQTLENRCVEPQRIRMQMRTGDQIQEDAGEQRSEEHKSELQSLMRISYAVFCLKKQKS